MFNSLDGNELRQWLETAQRYAEAVKNSPNLGVGLCHRYKEGIFDLPESTFESNDDSGAEILRENVTDIPSETVGWTAYKPEFYETPEMLAEIRKL